MLYLKSFWNLKKLVQNTQGTLEQKPNRKEWISMILDYLVYGLYLYHMVFINVYLFLKCLKQLEMNHPKF